MFCEETAKFFRRENIAFRVDSSDVKTYLFASAFRVGPATAMQTRGVGAVLAAACLFLFARLGRAGAFLFRAPAPVALRVTAACRARCTGARHAGTASIGQLSARSESWTEEDEVVCDRILSSIERAHARPDARLEHDDDFVRAPKDGELFDLMQSVLLKVARPPSLHVVCVSCRRAL